MTIAIVDYGMGNLGSLTRALENCHADVVVSDDPAVIDQVAGVILPGVGAFADGMANLNARGWLAALRALVAAGTPLLGICLGMQLLADYGEEGGGCNGLGLIGGAVRRLQPRDERERIPHVGWNNVHWRNASPLFADLANDSDFYFVHSYHFIPRSPDVVIATSDYCGGFAAALQQGVTFGVQFHPEKSSHGGMRLLRNFVALCEPHA